jgi:oxygen-dependent protoporphyrinogen oxidase
MSEAIDVAIVGGGISGLSAAYEVSCRRPELSLRLYEASSRVGGCIRTERSDGYVIEAGPDSFLRTKPEARRLCEELGLDAELITVRPEARSAYLVQAGELERLPAGMVLAAPTRLGPLSRTRLLSFSGKLRALADLVIPARTSAEDESIESFLTRRFGPELATRIGAPLLGGIYAGDIAELSVQATFPQLALLELRHRSVTYGLLASAARRGSEGTRTGAPLGALRSLFRSNSEAAPSPFLSLRGGLGTLTDRLEARIGQRSIVTGAGVIAIERDTDRFVLSTVRGPVRARAVILTTPAPVAARLLPAGRLSEELAGIRYGSTATIVFALDQHQVQRPLDASGFLVPPGEGRILAATWVSSKWEGRAPDGAVLIRAYVGGRHGEGDLSRPDSELVELARAELERLSGPLGTPRFTRLYRHERVRPQPAVGHRERLERVNAELSQLPGLCLAGAGYDGIGIPDCVRQARAAAERALRSMPHSG